jgi:hypothetical protein
MSNGQAVHVLDPAYLDSEARHRGKAARYSTVLDRLARSSHICRRQTFPDMRRSEATFCPSNRPTGGRFDYEETMKRRAASFCLQFICFCGRGF